MCLLATLSVYIVKFNQSKITMRTDIKILHSPCCAAESPVKVQIEKVVRENNLDVTITELSEINEIMEFGALSFPAIVVNGKVYDYKKVSRDEALLSIL